MSKRSLLQLKRKLKQLKITHDQVAAAVRSFRSPDGVHRTTVVRALAGDIKSAPVIEAAQRLVAERESAAPETSAPSCDRPGCPGVVGTGSSVS